MDGAKATLAVEVERQVGAPGELHLYETSQFPLTCCRSFVISSICLRRHDESELSWDRHP